MSLTMFTPDVFGDIDLFNSPLERTIDRAFNNVLAGRSQNAPQFPSLRGVHPMDVIETEKAYELHTDAPGMEPDEVKVEVHEGVLNISGEHKSERKTKDERGKVWRQERTFSKFSRQFSLPQNADPDAISATLDKGVLKVSVAKRPESEKPAPKRITVQHA